MSSLAAQTSLLGVITDGQGAAIPDAIVTARNAETSGLRKALTNSVGEYTMAQLQPGTYKVTVEKPGFRTHNTEVVLQVNTPATLNAKLELGAVTESVNVSAEVAVVNTENASVGNPFTETQVKAIPLQTRNVVALLSIEPGVAPTGQVLGARPDQNNVLLDGVDVNDNQGKDGFSAVLPIPLDSVQEFRTTVAGLGADVGRSAGGQVAIVTKGGSNQFHGSLYEYNRNTLTSANSWFSNRAGVARSALVRNQYGASLGGPVLKNRVFFFFNYEGRKDRSASAKTATVPTSTFAAGTVQVLLKDGRTVSLSPQDIANIDPLHIGASQYMLGLMKQYPAGNNPLGASDKGLNFNQLLFNAPQKLDNHAMVGRMDYNIDSAGRHSIMVRGTLNGAGQDTSLAQFPGQAAASRSLDNSRGIALRYTTVISPHLVNALNYGYTRLGTASTGNSTVIPSLGFTTLQATPRASQRVAPTSNITDDLTWTKGRHTIQGGVNFRLWENDRISFNNLPSYSFSRNTLLGLGADIDADVLAYLQPIYGSSIALSSGTNVTNAFGALLGLINQYSATYNYSIDGKAIPFGQPVTIAFAGKEFEEYVQDTFKWKRNLTITYGLRHSIFGVPYEKNGVQVVPQTPLSQFFADRVGGQALGIPGYALPSALVTYQLGGPLHNGAGYYPTDYKNFAPRLSIAWSPTPESGSLLEKLLGKGSVIRAGSGIVYDHYGSAMAASFASSGSPGLASAVAQPVNTNFTTGFRYSGSGLPVLPASAGGAFPYTPPTIQGGFTSFSGVSSDLKAPYSYLFNLNYARPIGHGMSLELGYAGRPSHRGIVQQDMGQPMTNFKDKVSGQTWSQAGTVLAQLYNSGITPAMVKANPSLIPEQPFFTNIFPGSKNQYITGSASANFFYDVFGNYSGSFLDGLNDMDRIRQSNGTCIAVYGCNTFFPLQNSGLLSYVNAGKSSYNAATVVLRRAVTHGWGYDFNYTFSHSLDNGSSSETAGGAALQDAFNPNAYRGPSDFDSRHAITADVVLELPVGKGKFLFRNAAGWLNQIVGGWQVTSLLSYHSGTPVNVTESGAYNVNYLYSALGILAPGAKLPANGLTFDQNGIPSIFANTSAVTSFVGSYPGQVGSRGILRGPGFFNTDMALAKTFRLFGENHRLQFRAEAFNALNNVNFGNPALSTATPTTFGEITGYASGAAARVMQFALRYEF
ncbi:MAG TPA: TonB-dependent receptor [Candidatus Sulfopaludibacter sp.]|nr:TonB-dependent receptor [Candidatus Sulfopaludibacter sp.]